MSNSTSFTRPLAPVWSLPAGSNPTAHREARARTYSSCVSARPVTLRRPLMALFGMWLVATSSTAVFASGSDGPPPPQPGLRLSELQTTLFKKETGATSRASHAQVVIAAEPYNLGKAILSGKYNFGKPKLTAANRTEKEQRLAVLQKNLPAPAKKQLDPSALSGRLTDREMNALEYYIRTRFNGRLAEAPSWAKKEPPPEIAASR